MRESGWDVSRGAVGDHEKRRRRGSKSAGFVSVWRRVAVKASVLVV